MNRKQKIALWIGLAVFLLIALLPLHAKKRFSTVGDSPAAVRNTTYHRIKPPQLYVYWIMAGVVTAVAMYSLNTE